VLPARLDLRRGQSRGAILAEADATQASFVGANLAGKMQRMSGSAIDFAGARLDEADLREARLEDASFKGASLLGVLGDGAMLGDAAWSGPTPRRVVAGRGAQYADASHAKLSSRLASRRSRAGELHRAKLEDARLGGANTKHVDRTTELAEAEDFRTGAEP